MEGCALASEPSTISSEEASLPGGSSMNTHLSLGILALGWVRDDVSTHLDLRKYTFNVGARGWVGKQGSSFTPSKPSPSG